MKELVKKLLEGDAWWGPLTVLLILVLSGFAGYAVAHRLNMDNANIVVGGLMALLGTLINFRYGASKKEKGDKEGNPS